MDGLYYYLKAENDVEIKKGGVIGQLMQKYDPFLENAWKKVRPGTVNP